MKRYEVNAMLIGTILALIVIGMLWGLFAWAIKRDHATESTKIAFHFQMSADGTNWVNCPPVLLLVSTNVNKQVSVYFRKDF